MIFLKRLWVILFCTALMPLQAEETEIKFYVTPDAVEEALRKVREEFAKEPPEPRRIYFLDTEDLRLYNGTDGPVILRVRRKDDKKPESTVKLRRPADHGFMPGLKEEFQKLEIQREITITASGLSDDGEGASSGLSFALDKKHDKALEELDRYDAGDLTEWFSEPQKKLLSRAGIILDPESLRIFGGVDAQFWKWEESEPRVAGEVSAELWRLGGETILEFSCKRKEGDARKQAKDFAAFFRERGISIDEAGESKTKRALVYFRPGRPAFPSADARWHKTGEGKLMGIGGIALLEQSAEEISFLVVHDNKKDGEDRAGVVKRGSSGTATYSRLDWSGGKPPEDLEALTVIPGAREEFLAVTSRGKISWIRLTKDRRVVEVLRELQLPGATTQSQIEGFDLSITGNHLVAVWADRGTGADPAQLSWSQFHLDREKPFSEVSHYSLQVPWPAGGDVRDISDLRVDAVGAVFISSALESEENSSNTKFASAVYLAGVLEPVEEGGVRFRPNLRLTPLHRFEGRKVEAMELVPGREGGIVFATDDEHRGSSVFFSR